ncbi:MAG: hypothetical protein ACFFD1_00540 [Candidatus Thorarchaeota archaeon]
MKSLNRYIIGTFILIMVFSTISSLIVTPFLYSSDLTYSDISKTKNTSLNNSDRYKLNTPVVNRTYSPGETLGIEGFVNLLSDPNPSYNNPTNFWPIPKQSIEIYYSKDPISASSYPVSNELAITGGTNQTTTGTDANTDGKDDIWGFMPIGSANYNTVINGHLSGYYNVTVTIPDQSTLQSLGITNYFTLIEAYPGNLTIGINGGDKWILNQSIIQLSNTAQMSVSQSVPSILSDGQIDFTFTTLTSGGSPISGIPVHIEIFNQADNSTICTDIPSCQSSGFDLTLSANSTDSSGIVSIHLQMLYPPVIRGDFGLYVTALTNPSVPPYVTNQPANIGYFTVVTNTATITGSGPVTMRPDENKILSYLVTSDYNISPIAGIPLSYQIINLSTGLPICGPSNCASIGFTITNSSSQSDINGNISYSITADYTKISDGQYSFNVTGIFNANIHPFVTNYSQGQVIITIDRSAKTALLSVINSNPNTNIFRPGDSESLSLTSQVKSVQFPLNPPSNFGNVPMVVSLWNKTSGSDVLLNNATITSSFGFFYVVSGTNSDPTGLFSVNINTDPGLTPVGKYSLRIIGDYSSFMGPTEYVLNASSDPQYYNFTIDYLYDSLNIVATVSPGTTTQPYPAPGSIVTIRVDASRIYNTSRILNPPGSSTISGLRISPTFVSNSSGIIMTIDTGLYPSVGGGYYLTNANGAINVTITSTYPITYLNIIKQVKFSVLIVSADTPFLRYFNTSLGQYTLSTDLIQTITVDPQYQIIDVVPATIPTNVTGNILALGHALQLNFFVENITDNNIPASNIPVKFSITSGVIPGVYLTFLNGTLLSGSSYIKSDGSGMISIAIKTTYGVTPESASLSTITITATANLTEYYAFNSYLITGPPYFIGEFNAGSSTFAQFSNTWSTGTMNVGLKANYTFSKPTINPDFTLLRPGEDVNISVTIQTNSTTPVTLTGFQFPVNASLSCFVNNVLTPCPSIGVSISVADIGSNPNLYPGFYMTTTNAQIIFTVSSVYNVNFPKFFTVRLNVTVDYQNKTGSNPSYDERFIVGLSSVIGFNRSQASLTTNQLQNITYDPQYYTGLVEFVSTSVPSLGGSKVAVPTAAGVIADITFRAYLNVIGFPSLTGVSVTINSTLLSQYNFTLIGAPSQLTGINGLVVFQINVTTATMDGLYPLQASADYLNDASMTPPLDPLNGNRPIANQWINGTSSDGSTSISSYTGQEIQVLRKRLLIVNILEVRDQNNDLISTGPTNVFAYRGYTLTLNVTYIKDDATPVNIASDFIVYYNSSKPNSEIMIGQGTTSASTGNVVFTTPLSNASYPFGFYPGVAELYAVPTDPSFNSTNVLFVPYQFRIKATPHFINLQTNVSPSTSTLKANDYVQITGSIRDELGLPLNSTYYLPNTLSELVGNIQVYGSNSANTIIYSGNVSTSLDSVGNFVISYGIPTGFPDSTISIRIEIEHNISVLSYNLSLTSSILVDTYNTYQYVKISQQLQSIGGGSPFPVNILTNNSVINIDGNTNAYYTTIIIQDNYDRPLKNFNIDIFDNSSLFVLFATDNSGIITYNISPNPEYYNSSRYFYFSYINGTTNEILYSTINHNVYDITPPYIGFLEPNLTSPSSYSYLYNNFTIVINTFDWNASNGIVSTGFNQNSLEIYYNGSLQAIVPGNWINGNTYSTNFDYSSLPTSVTAINVTIVMIDNSGLSNKTTLIITFDRKAPIFNSINPGNLSYPYQISSVIANVTDYENYVILVNMHIDFNNGTILDFGMSPNGPEMWQRSINFDDIGNNVNIEFNATDIAGNSRLYNLIYLKDNIAPSITLTSIDISRGAVTIGGSVYISPGDNVTVTLTAVEAESGIDVNSGLITNFIGTISIVQNPLQLDQYFVNFSAPYVSSNLIFSLSLADKAGNIDSKLLFTILADNQAPDISWENPTENSQQNSQFTLTFSVTDTKSGINPSKVVLINEENGQQLSPSQTPITNGFRYSIDVTPTFNSQNETQRFSLLVQDYYFNSNSSFLDIKVDVKAPQITGYLAKDSTDTDYINNPTDFVATSSHDILISYSDPVISSGISDVTYTLSYSSDGSSYNNINYLDNTDKYQISFNHNSTQAHIIWNTTLGTNSEVPEGFYKWTVVVYDGVNHASTLEITYQIRYQRPSLLDQLISLGTTLVLSLAVFGTVGIIVAFIYEKVRYE